MLGVLHSLCSCEEVVNPVLVSGDPVLVIDARLTDRPGYSYVKLSTTAPFSGDENIPPATGAVVTVSDARGIIANFIERQPGLYLPISSGFSAVPGNRYTLNVSWETEEYRAETTMALPVKMDSISLKKRVNSAFFTDGYYITPYFRDPINRSNYYMWEMRNQERRLQARVIYLLNDENLNGQYFSQELTDFIPIDSLVAGDTLQVSMFTLERDAYAYFQGLSLLTESGSPAQAVPDNPLDNITGNGIGFFLAAPVDTISVVVVD